MFRRTYHVATLYRSIALGSSILLGGCAMRGADRMIVSVAPESAPSAEKVRQGYVVDTPAFALVTTSSSAKAIAVESLRGSVATFQWLFDNPAPHIGVLVADGHMMSPPATATMMPEDLTTIMVMAGDPDPADSARSAAELESALRTMSADAWLHDYANQWSAAVDVDAASAEGEAEAAASRAEALPHWLRVGTLRVMAEGKEPARTALPAATLPLRELFGYALQPAEVGLVARLLHHPDRLAQATSEQSYDEIIARSFIMQSASVVRFLRDTQGGAAVSDLFGASMTGMPIDEILAQLPHATSVEDMERNWQRWESAHYGLASAEVKP